MAVHAYVCRSCETEVDVKMVGGKSETPDCPFMLSDHQAHDMRRSWRIAGFTIK